MAPSVNPTTPEYKEKKMKIAGVIDFNDANNIKYSRIKLFQHFGIHFTTGYQWFPVTGSTNPRRRRPNVENVKSEHESVSLKRARSEDSEDEISAFKHEADQTAGLPRQNPVQNGGRDRKKLKAIVEGLTEQASSSYTPLLISTPSISGASSPPPPQQLLAPPKGKRGRPRKRVEPQSGRGAQHMEIVVVLKNEDMDDNIFGAV